LTPEDRALLLPKFRTVFGVSEVKV